MSLWVMTIAGMVQAGFGCIYPISLLIVMNTRSVKQYYEWKPT